VQETVPPSRSEVAVFSGLRGCVVARRPPSPRSEGGAGGDVAEDPMPPEPSGHDTSKEGRHQNERDIADYANVSFCTLLRSSGLVDGS